MSRVWRRYALAHAHTTIGSLSPRQFPRRYCYCSLQSHLMSPQTARKQATKAAASASFSASAKYNGKSLCRCRHRPSLATAESVGEQLQKEFETYHSVTICRYCCWLHLNWFLFLPKLTESLRFLKVDLVRFGKVLFNCQHHMAPLYSGFSGVDRVIWRSPLDIGLPRMVIFWQRRLWLSPDQN